MSVEKFELVKYLLNKTVSDINRLLSDVKLLQDRVVIDSSIVKRKFEIGESVNIKKDEDRKLDFVVADVGDRKRYRAMQKAVYKCEMCGAGAKDCYKLDVFLGGLYNSRGRSKDQSNLLVLCDVCASSSKPLYGGVLSKSKKEIERQVGCNDRLKGEIIRRDNYTCTICGGTGVPMEIDHIIPIAKGGISSKDNLRTVCKRCNRGKSDLI